MKTPASDRVCDALCLTAALWTVCCHGVVAFGGSLNDLLAVFFASSVIIGLVFLRQRLRRSQAFQSLSPALANQLESTLVPADSVNGAPVALAVPGGARNRLMPVVRGMGMLLGIVALVLFVRNDRATDLWHFSAAVLSLAFLTVLITSPQPVPHEPARRSGVLETALWTIGVGCVVLTLVCHRPDWDDSFYVNMAVAACDAPSEPLLAKDTMYGVAGLDLHMPAYRVHSYEIFNGALARVTGIPAIYCFHWISASLAALVVPLAFARLFRILIPCYWLWGVIAVLVVLVVTGEMWRSYGNYAFVRMWTGKSIYLSLLLPLAYAYGLRFGAAPTLRNWILMAAVQIAAVGCTSSALWSVPMATCMAMACSVRLNRSTLRILTLGVAASAYIICAGLIIKTSMGSGGPVVTPPKTPGVGLSFALGEALGAGTLKACGVASFMIAWALLQRGPAQRFAVLLPLVSLLLILNPYLQEHVCRYLIGPSYWRAMWIMPIPILLALVLTSPLQWHQHPAATAGTPAMGFALPRSRIRLATPYCATVVAIMGFALLVPQVTTLSRENSTILGYPHLKVRWGGSYKWAEELHEGVPPGSKVVAPWPTALWMPTFHHRSHPLIIRYRHYGGYLARELGMEDVEYRMFMSDAVASGVALHSLPGSIDWDAQDELARKFREGLERYHVSGVCMSTSSRLREIRPILTSAGFTPLVKRRLVEIWTRPSVPASETDLRVTDQPDDGGGQSSPLKPAPASSERT